MGIEESYQGKLDVLRAMEDSRVQKPHHIPVAVYIQEADDLYLSALEDREALTGAGLAWDVVEDMPARSEALSMAEAIFQSRRQPWENVQQELNNRYIEAQDLKKKILNDFRFAFQKHPQLLKLLGEYSKGESRAALIQALNELSLLGRENLPLLAAIRFDMSLLDSAARLSEELSNLAAAALSERMKPNEAADIRNRAYTHLKEAVDLVRGYGKLVFFGDKERRKWYISEYMRQLNMRRARRAKMKKKEAKKADT